MSNLIVRHQTKKISGAITLPTSKSISNRLLVLQKLTGFPTEITQLSTSEDTRLMQQAMQQIKGTVNVNHAGTCLRFLTAYYACLPEADVILHGSERLHQRPIGPLVNALTSLGADIDYIDQVGFAPLRIKGKHMHGGVVQLDASISSQFVSALMLIAPVFKNGLVITQQGKMVSKPYVQMTAKLLNQIGIACTVKHDVVIKPFHQAGTAAKTMKVEMDWSAASFWYVMAGLSQECNLLLNQLSTETTQGDSVIANYMERFGVMTEAVEQGIHLQKSKPLLNQAYYDMLDYPDLVPPLAVLMCALNCACTFTNVAHLQAKESHRLTALCTELTKCGFDVSHTENDLVIKQVNQAMVKAPDFFDTYNDHRMAMSFSLLALKFNQVNIKNMEVVEKSYPNFWQDLKQVGFELETTAE